MFGNGGLRINSKRQPPFPVFQRRKVATLGRFAHCNLIQLYR